jgi:hypothetical protein
MIKNKTEFRGSANFFFISAQSSCIGECCYIIMDRRRDESDYIIPQPHGECWLDTLPWRGRAWGGNLFYFLLLFICAYKAWVISPPAPIPSLTTHSTPSLSPPPPQYPAEIILPLSLILL